MQSSIVMRHQHPKEALHIRLKMVICFCVYQNLYLATVKFHKTVLHFPDCQNIIYI